MRSDCLSKTGFIRKSLTAASLSTLITGLLLASPAGFAQDATGETLASWVALDAPTGYEHLATDALVERYPNWERDRFGNLMRTIGSGSPHRVVACALDAYSYSVTQITDEGYLRLHRIGSGSRHPLWDQFHEGQHLRILTRSGPVIGVSAIANGHFAYQHRNETAIVTADDLWLDVGAESAADVEALGIQLLDPVLRDVPAWSYSDEVAGPRSGARIGCAAVLAAAEAGLNGASGRTTYVMSAQQVFGWVGLSAALNRLSPMDELIVLGPGEDQPRNELVDGLGGRIDTVLAATVQSLRVLAPAVSAKDALMERVDLDAANTLLAELTTTINPGAAVPSWQAAPVRRVALNGESDRWGVDADVNRLSEIEAMLDSVAELSATPGHEGPIRAAVFAALPDWARDAAQVDDIGNLWVEFGPPGEAMVFMAHMDEVGYEIAGIESSGVIELRRLGGVVTTAWEGQPAVLTLDPETNRSSLAESPQLRGVFLTRDSAIEKAPESVQAWFGMNAEQLSAAGVRVGMGITGYKEGHRMGAYRYASRSLDDRVGTTALALALQDINPDDAQSRVIFAWSVREEGGLNGATAMAARIGTQTRRVYSVDTFVSSDTPLESTHFAYVRLGTGPVFRAIENASLAVPAELDRNRAIATAAGIQFNIGLTQGSTDGTAFTFYGAPNTPISWPGRYSHSPAEIADLRDVASLIDLIKALAVAPADAP